MIPKILDHLGEADRRELVRAGRTRRFAKGEVIFHEGDHRNTRQVVLKGHVAVRITTPLGDVATFAVFGPGDHFGELALISAAERSATASALDPVETLAITIAQLDELRHRFPAVDRLMVEALAATVRRVSVLLSEALFVPVDKRVYRRLLDLRAVFGTEASPSARVPVKQEMLAELAGTTRPTANRALRIAEDVGALTIGRGWIEVLDAEWLERRSR
ncbi:Crp/Fnr family transcriptional regulator [soil metagenome]